MSGLDSSHWGLMTGGQRARWSRAKTLHTVSWLSLDLLSNARVVPPELQFSRPRGVSTQPSQCQLGIPSGP